MYIWTCSTTTIYGSIDLQNNYRSSIDFQNNYRVVGIDLLVEAFNVAIGGDSDESIRRIVEYSSAKGPKLRSVCVTLNRTNCKAVAQLVRQVAVMMSLLRSTSFIVSILRFILQICGQIVIIVSEPTKSTI
jgi:hypothetical protein